MSNNKQSEQNTPPKKNANKLAVAAFVVSLVSVCFSGWSVYESQQANLISQKIAKTTAEDSQRRVALDSFFQSYNEYLKVMDESWLKIPYRIESPKILASLTDVEMEEVAASAEPALRAYRDYTGKAGTVAGVWSNETDAKISSATTAANSFSHCLIS